MSGSEKAKKSFISGRGLSAPTPQFPGNALAASHLLQAFGAGDSSHFQTFFTALG